MAPFDTYFFPRTMQKELAVVLSLSLMLVLNACENPSIPSTTGAGDSSASAIQEHSQAAQTFPDQETWTLVKAWAPEAEWSAPTAGTNDDVITIDENHDIPAHAMQARSIGTTMAWKDFDRRCMATVSRDALDRSLQRQGWKHHLALDADGPMGTVWGYKMDGNDGTRFLIISGSGKNCTETSDHPTECSAFDVKATVTDALPKGADL